MTSASGRASSPASPTFPRATTKRFTTRSRGCSPTSDSTTRSSGSGAATASPRSTTNRSCTPIATETRSGSGLPPATEPGGARYGTAVALAGWSSFLLIGWIGLLVPSLILSIERDFGQTDAGIGLFYFLNAVAYALGSLGGGLLTERLGRRAVLVGALVLQAVGLGAQGLVLDWLVFVVAGIPRGLGSGAIDGGAQSLFLDAFPERSVRAMNVLHVFFSVGALVTPLAVAGALGAGVTWPALMTASAVASAILALVFGVIRLPSGRHARIPSTGPSAFRIGRISLPLVVAAIAIACYVAAEVGLSSWLVAFLAAAPLAVASVSLSLFWAGLTVGRLVTARLADRLHPVRLAVGASLVAAVAITVAVAAAEASIEASIVLFAVAGFAFGPVYPTIVVIGGRIQPGRSAAVTGMLAGVAVVGATLYPPLMGAISDRAGLGAAMVGTALLSAATAVLLLAVRLRPSPNVEVG
jgi:fucose permease